MAMNNRTLSLNDQIKSIRDNCPNWKYRLKGIDCLILDGEIQPSIVSPVYKARITFQPGIDPEIKILDPELKLYPGKKSLPHVFGKDSGSLCLFFKYEFDNKKDLLSETIIVWITWWLYYYEIWLQTGCWVARGTHPESW
jgi:hypothetical protein